MGYAKHLVEPWGLLAATVAGGAAWAAHLPAPTAAGIGAGVLLLKVVLFGRSKREREPEERQRPVVEVAQFSDEAGWLRRAVDAEREFADVAGSLPPGPLAEQVAGMTATVNGTVDTLHRLAGRVTATHRALARVDLGTLAADDRRLRAAKTNARADDVRAELDKSLASVRDQREVHGRLTAARDRLLAQLESGAIGLAGLVARAVELATSPPAFPEADPVTDLAEQLEGIRRGVAETDETTRRVLGLR
ncbi:hypothetical protein [Actinokineospora spheciospongiae]|uniref:hypothetical protein n=1 Tax=Actinokineospora spheciospongiae TaxID=909613 RepID=UPI000D71CC7B|nr:hypothetical protein [Actinokineospora spheciospongiae]PWW62060.1 hypothetical protein DFQ13_106312 [Actinokineospora spheciospongiae]